jgi:hypothetical protein
MELLTYARYIGIGGFTIVVLWQVERIVKIIIENQRRPNGLPNGSGAMAEQRYAALAERSTACLERIEDALREQNSINSKLTAGVQILLDRGTRGAAAGSPQ